MGQIVSITAYSLSAYAIDVNGTVCAWGLSSSGQCSTGNTSNVTTPVVITALTTPVAKLVFNGNTTYALDTSGYLWTWGYSNVGQLGNGGTDYVMTAARLTVTDPDDSTVTILFKDIAIESAAGLALDTTGRIWGWGTGGKIGDGTTTASYIPVRVRSCPAKTRYFSAAFMPAVPRPMR
jgi:alpha-tubulin suppressor-like RCC1 family protein